MVVLSDSEASAQRVGSLPPDNEPSPEAWPARIVGGRYRLHERLGEGTSGVVWKAEHLALGKSFALKLLHPEIAADDASRARFEREAEVLGRLQHPNIISITDFGFDGPDEGTPFLVTEIVEGVSLADALRQHGAIPLARALPILRGVASALDAAHDAGVIHRDVKPQNILIEGDQASPVPRVLDFGIAAFRAEGRDQPPDAPSGDEPRLTDRGALLGTPVYVAPELIRQPLATAASDVYSLGVVAYEMLAGAPPFVGTTAEILRGHLEREPPRTDGLRSLPDEAWDALRAALSKDPSRRPARPSKFVLRLQEAQTIDERREYARHVRMRGLWMSLVLTAAAGLLTEIPPVAAQLRKLERTTRDWRLAHAAPRAPDPRIVLVTLEDSGEQWPGGSLADAGDEVGAGLAVLLQAGARGVALDLVLPPKWAASSVFSDVVVRHPDQIVLGAQAAADGTIVGTDCVAGFTTLALGPTRAAGLFGVVNVLEDEDGSTRRARLSFTDDRGVERPVWAAAAAQLLGPIPPSPRNTPDFRIDLRTDPRGFGRIRWADLAERVARNPSIVRDRLVLVGADFVASGEDVHRVPGREGQKSVSGLTLQALIVNTILAGRPLRPAPPWPFLAAFLLAATLSAAGTFLARRTWVVVVATSGVLAAYAGCALLVSNSSGVWWPIAQAAAIVSLALVASLGLRARLRQGSEPRRYQRV